MFRKKDNIKDEFVCPAVEWVPEMNLPVTFHGIIIIMGTLRIRNFCQISLYYHNNLYSEALPICVAMQRAPKLST